MIESMACQSEGTGSLSRSFLPERTSAEGGPGCRHWLNNGKARDLQTKMEPTEQIESAHMVATGREVLPGRQDLQVNHFGNFASSSSGACRSSEVISAVHVTFRGDVSGFR